MWNATTGGIIAVLPGHKIVAEAEFSKPGSRLVTRDAANARLWDTATGNLVNELGGSVETLMFNSDGTRLLTVAKPESAQTKPTIQLWDTATGTLVKVLEGHLGEIDDPIFNKDGTRLVTTSKQNPTARLWNGLTGELCAELNGHDGPVSAVFDPTGTRLLTSAKNDTVAILWYADTGRQVSQLQGHSGAVKSSLFDSTGTLLATAGRDDRTIRVWDAHGGTLVASLDGHQRPIVGLAFSPDGHRLLSRADGEEAARMWDLKPRASAPSRPLPKVLGDGANTVPRGNAVVIFDRSGSPVADAPGAALLVRADDQIVLKVLGGHSDAVHDAWFFAGNKRLLTSEGNEGARLLLWDAESGTQLRVLKHASGEMAASQSAYFADGQRLATMASGDRSVQLWNSVTGEHVKELTGHGAAVSALVMSQTGGRLVSRAKGETFALLWDAATGEKIGTGLLDGHPGEVSRVAISDAGDRIATAGDGSSAIKLWNGLTGGLVGDLNGHAGPAIENMAFSKDSKLLLTQAKDDAVAWLWNAETGKPLFKLIGQEEFLTSATFSLDGLHAVTLSNTLSNEFKVRRVWSLATGQQVTKFQHDGGGQPTWLCSPSKPHEVAEWCTSRAAGDKVVLLWNNKTGQLIARLAGHIGAVSSAKFTKDGRRLVTWAAADNEARLWDSEHGGVLVRSLPHAAAVTSVLVTQDDALIVTRATGDPIARLWDAKTGNPVAELGFRNTSSLRTMMLVKNDNQLLTVSGDAVRLWDIRGFSMDRTKEAYDLVCDGQENASKRRFSPSEMADPILKGADTLQQPCDRVGPLRLKYWKTLLARSGHGVR